MIEFVHVLIIVMVLMAIAAIILYTTGNRIVYWSIAVIAISILFVWSYYDGQESERIYLTELPHIQNKINQSRPTSDAELLSEIRLYCSIYSSKPIQCENDLKKKYFSLS